MWLEHLPPECRFLFGREDGALWRPHDWNNWRKRHFHAVTQALDLGRPRPYDLRHSFASLRIREHGASLVDLAAQLGHAPTETLKTYSHVYAEYRRKPPQPADALIRDAREVHATRGPSAHGSR